MARRVIGAKQLEAKLRKQPQLVGRTLESLVKQEGRALCVEYGKATVPGPGFDEAKDNQFRKRVETDVRRVFADRDRPNSIYNLMKIHSPLHAKAYWHAIKSQKPRAAADIMRKANLPTGLNPAAHKAVRTGRKGRVPGNTKPVSLANAASLNAFVRKQRALVGFAKAGWLAAAKAIGGRVRNAEGTGEAFPKHIRALVAKFPGIGGADYKESNGVHTLAIFTRVKHAQEALPEGLRLSAETRAKERFIASLAKAITAATTKTFRRAA